MTTYFFQNLLINYFLLYLSIIRLAGELGFEPKLTASKAAVLPLHHSPILDKSFISPLNIKFRGAPRVAPSSLERSMVVGVTGIEPAASRSQSARSTTELHPVSLRST